ncbi:MAG: spondin domain-containing protein [Alphaproteobacteria bacterium]
MRIRSLLTGGIVAAAISAVAAPALAITVQVTVTNISPNGGVVLTPLWVGFHNGSFDSYDGGSAIAAELERLAEDGNTAPISGAFLAGNTLVPTGVAQVGSRVDGTIGGLLMPGESADQSFQVDINGANQFFSCASMALPSNDYYVANGNPLQFDLAALLAGGSTSFFIRAPGTVNDAGTEVNDFADSPGNPLFRIPAGQTAPDQGVAENGVNTNVVDAFANFHNIPAGGVPRTLDFNSYTGGGIARIDIAVAPVPGSLVMMGTALLGAGFIAPRCMKK